MNCAETKLIEILKDLKENYCVRGLKLEFEAEGATFEEAEISKKLCEVTGLNLIVKIGGCGAVRDLSDAKKIKANTIVAPMIETPYALEKYIRAIENTFEKEEIKNTNFFIDVETQTGYKNIDEILALKSFVTGVVVGRSDLAGSLGFKKEDVNSDKIFEITNEISKKVEPLGKKFIVGGSVLPKSMDFFKKLSYLSAFETRKIIFHADALKSDNLDKGIMKAIEFEIEWLKYKKDLSSKDQKRLEYLEKQLVKM